MADDLRYNRYIGTDECLGYADSTSSELFQCFSPRNGSWIIITKPFFSGSSDVYHRIFSIGDSGTNRIELYTTDNNGLAVYASDGTYIWSTSIGVIESKGWTAGTWQPVIFSYNVNTSIDGTNVFKLYYQGPRFSIANDTDPVSITAPALLTIGRNWGGGTYYNGILYYAFLDVDVPAYLLYDDFSDNVYTSRASGHPNYPTWTVSTGTWSAASGYLEKTASAATWQTIYTADTNFDDVVWEFTTKQDDDTQAFAISLSDSIGYLSGDGYDFVINSSFIKNDFRRIDAGVSTTLETISWTSDTDEHNWRIERRSGGNWTIYLDGVSILSAIDNTYTSIAYINVSFYDTSARLDNLRVYRMNDTWARKRLMMVEDLYNFTGTADVWDGVPFWVDENSLLVPKHCLDVNKVLVATNLDIVSWPSLMQDNSDYDATKHNMIDDGNMEHSGIGDWTTVGTPTTEQKVTMDGGDLFDTGAGGFEGARGVDGWTPWVSNTIEVSTDKAQTGTKSAKVTYVDHADGARCYFRDSSDLFANLVVGKKYRVVFWAAVGGAYSVGFRIWDGTGYGPDIPTSSTTMVKMDKEFIALSTDGCFFKQVMEAGEVVYIDDISIREVADCVRTGLQSYEVISDATDEGFEQTITGLTAGDDLYVGVDYNVTRGNLKLQVLNATDDSIIESTLADETTPNKTANGNFNSDSLWSKGTGWSIVVGDTVISPGGIPSAEAFGDVRINMPISVGGIASVEAVGEPDIVALQNTLAPLGKYTIVTAEAFGTPSVTGDHQLDGGGIASAEAVGNPTVIFVDSTPAPTGIPSGDAFGQHIIYRTTHSVARCDGTQVANSDLSQDMGLTVSNVYRVSFRVTNYSAGNVKPLAGSSGGGISRSANGRYIQDLVCLGNSTGYIRADLDFVGDIDDVRFMDLTNAYFEEYRTCVEVPTGETSITLQCVSDNRFNDFFIDKIFCHNSLIENGGMEGTYDDESGGGGGTVNVAPGWNAYQVETDGTDTLDKETTIIHSGSASQKIDVNVNAEGIQQILTGLTGDEWYTLSVWIFIESGSVNIIVDGAESSWYSKTANNIGVWERYLITFKEKTGESTATHRITSLGAAAKFYVDDVSIVELDEASPSTNTATTEALSYETGAY